MNAPRRAVVGAAVFALVIGMLLVLTLLGLARSRSEPEDTRQNPTGFRVGQASRLARTVARLGPLLFADLRGGSRDIFVQHLGGDDWRAFEAHPPGAPRRCQLRWQDRSRTFVDSCGPGQSYPADGTGLVTYPTRIDDDGWLVVELHRPRPPGPPSATSEPLSPPPS